MFASAHPNPPAAHCLAHLTRFCIRPTLDPNQFWPGSDSDPSQFSVRRQLPSALDYCQWLYWCQAMCWNGNLCCVCVCVCVCGGYLNGLPLALIAILGTVLGNTPHTHTHTHTHPFAQSTEEHDYPYYVNKAHSRHPLHPHTWCDPNSNSATTGDVKKMFLTSIPTFRWAVSRHCTITLKCWSDILNCESLMHLTYSSRPLHYCPDDVVQNIQREGWGGR